MSHLTQIDFLEPATVSRPERAERAGSETVPCLNRIFSNETPKAGKLSSYHAKVAFALSQNVSFLVKRYGVERVGFLTLTTGGKNGLSMREFQRRFNSLATGFLRKRYRDYIMVMERGDKTNRVHAHLLVVLPQDIRTGFDFDEVKNGNYRSANKFLRSEWATWRGLIEKYGFGRRGFELLPIRTNAEAIAKYVGKYVSKQVGKRQKADRGAKLVRYGGAARVCSTRFAFASVRSFLWRKKIARLAEKLGLKTFEDFIGAFGTRWCKHLAEGLASVKLGHYATRAQAAADGVDVFDIPDDVENIRVHCRHSFDGYSSAELEKFLRRDSRSHSELSGLLAAMKEEPGSFAEDLSGMRKGLPARVWNGQEYIVPERYDFPLDPDWSVEGVENPVGSNVNPF